MRALPPPPPVQDDWSLFLDLDGTLVDFAERPEAIDVCDRLRGLLGAVHQRLGGRVAVVSGRALSDLDGRLALPELALAGSHGAERRAAGAAAVLAEHTPAVAAATAEAQLFAAEHGLICEAKPTGVALHFRPRADLEAAVEAFAADLARRHALRLQRGAMVRELRAPGLDKGDALRLFMAEAPFSAGTPVMVGDDVTDEDGFAAANALGGTSVLVGPERDTVARFRLADVAAVRQWLQPER